MGSSIDILMSKIRTFLLFFSLLRVSLYLVNPLGDNHIRVGNGTRLHAVSVLDFTPFSYVGTIVSRPTISRYFYFLGHLAAGVSHSIT